MMMMTAMMLIIMVMIMKIVSLNGGSACTVNDLMAGDVTVATPRVKTWFIIKRLFEPEESTDAAPASGGDGDAAPHVTVKVENAVVDGGVMKEVKLLCSCGNWT